MSDPGWGQRGRVATSHLPPLGLPVWGQHLSGALCASLPSLGRCGPSPGGRDRKGGPLGSSLLLPHAGSWQDPGQHSQLPASHPLPAVAHGASRCQENAGDGCCRDSFPLPSPLKPALRPAPPHRGPRGAESPLAPGEPSASGLGWAAPLPHQARGDPGTPTWSSPARSSRRAWHCMRYLERSREGLRGGYWGGLGCVTVGEDKFCWQRDGAAPAGATRPCQDQDSHGFYCFGE